MFANPFLKQEFLEKEISAVNGEYVNDLSKDIWKTYGLTCQLAEGKYNKFTVGNRESLMKDGVRDQMENFRSQYYTAVNMALVIQSSESLSTMQNLIEENLFSQIPQGQPNFESLSLDAPSEKPFP